MKNAARLASMLMTVVGSFQLMASPLPKPQNECYDQIVNLSDIDDHGIQDFSQGKMINLILECPEGAILPLKIVVKGQCFALEATREPLYLRVLETCYVRCVAQEEFLFSTDLQTWRGFLEFFTGQLQASIGIEKAGPVAILELELNPRKGYIEMN